MDRYCTECGSRLEKRRTAGGSLKAVLYSCPSESWSWFLDIDKLGCSFSLQPLAHGVGEAAASISDEALDEALGKIKELDAQTVSIAAFEKFILGLRQSPALRRRI